MALQFGDGVYVERGGDGDGDGDPASFTRTELASLAAYGEFVGTFTARLGANVDVDHPQPAIWSVGPIQEQRGPQEFPELSGEPGAIVVSGRHIREGATVFVDGRRALGSVRCQSGALPACDGETVEIELVTGPGMHFVQVQNPDGLFSNDFIFTGRPVAGGGGTTPGPQGEEPETGAFGSPLPPGPPGGPPPAPPGEGFDPDGADVFTAADGTRFRTDTVVAGLESPASLAFAPDGRLFVAEGPGRVRVVREGHLLPEPALVLADGFASGNLRLLGLALDPGFAGNGFVYALEARVRPGASATARVVRYREVGGALGEAVVLLDDLPVGAADGGGALRFGPDGLLYVTAGEARQADAAQDLASYGGKILRLRPDGAAPGRIRSRRRCTPGAITWCGDSPGIR